MDPMAAHQSPAPSMTGAMATMAAPSGDVVQASYAQAMPPSNGPVEVYDSSMAKVPIATYPGQAPVAMHSKGSCGCSSCSGVGVYQPIYANGFGADSCSNSSGCLPCTPQGGYDPQEYIYDGGDQSPAVRIRNDYSIVGLGPEDTVVQFTTEDGREFAETGCRTAIYAPRFASVRRITSFGTSDGVLAAQAALRDEPLVHMHAPVPPIQVAERLKANNESNVKVVEAFRDRNRGVPVLQNQGPQGWTNAFRPYEDLQLIRHGVVEETERVALLKSAANAIAWSTVDELMVFVDNKSTALIETEDHPQELLTYELGDARIRLCKVASQQSANVGDVVDFTIRFDNTAEQILSD